METKIEAVALELNAVVHKDRPNYPEPLRTFEERRIDWEDKGIRKAIIIQPTFEYKGVNSDLWNFCLVAWKGVIAEQSYHKKLVSKSDFEAIETDIDELLAQGKGILIAVKEEDLK
jgi:hypothetical protein